MFRDVSAPREADAAAHHPAETADGRPRSRRIRRAQRRANRAQRRANRAPAARRVRRVVGVLVLGILAVVGLSLGKALARGSDPASVKFVEWVRAHGGSGIVNVIERTWYEHHQPSKGGTPKGGIPKVPAPIGPAKTPTIAAVARKRTADRYVPRSINAIASPALPGEGVWQPTGRLVHGRPALYETFLRPDRGHTSLLAGVAWLDRRALRAVVYNGNDQPGGSGWIHGDHVQPSGTSSLVAAFNGGFRLDMAQGGYQSEGRVVRPLVPGRATFGVRADGTVDVGTWGRDLLPTTPYAAAFQCLDLIVDNGNDVQGLTRDDHLRWGQTLGGRVFVWRSGVGIDTRGNLVYAAGMLDIVSLADILRA
ncbi:MAG: hypothetical protein QOJ71_2708, partial [Actinomycetota bacterium]|nr:hypothetical protein [Actinomycetota bacterium]